MAETTSPVMFTLNMSRKINAPKDRVFRAWTTLEDLRKWWGPQGFTLPTAELDLRVGGKYRFDMSAPDGNVYVVGGTYLEIHAPDKIVYTWRWEGAPQESETVVTVEFREEGAATNVILTHEKFAVTEERTSHEEGWVGCFTRLEKLF